MLVGLTNWKWLAVAGVFALCLAPTFISYQPYLFEWDDAAYLRQSIEVSRAFWTGNVRGLGAMVGIRPPAMTLLGLPWGPLSSWEATGKCFITLASLTALLAALSFYFLLRIGVNPFLLIAASLCVLASLGPFLQSPPSLMNWVEMGAAAHYAATAFLADGLFAWTSLAAILLIPFEARKQNHSIRAAALAGILWGLILSLGVMTKINFLYFIVLIVPALFLIRFYRGGMRNALVALTAFVFSSSPAAFYLIRWGRPAFANLQASSFGGIARFYFIPLTQFLRVAVRESPGLLLFLVLTITGLAYIAVKRRLVLWDPDLWALLIMIGFSVIVLSAPNRQIRYLFPAIVALPFLTAILLSAKGDAVPRRSAGFAAGLIFLGIFVASLPMRHRPDRECLRRSDAVLALASTYHAKSVLLATDSPTLNFALLQLATDLSESGSPVSFNQIGTLAYQAATGAPVEKDFEEIGKAHLVVFQDAGAVGPPFTNLRVSDYERSVLEAGYSPIRIDDVTVYVTHRKP